MAQLQGTGTLKVKKPAAKPTTSIYNGLKGMQSSGATKKPAAKKPTYTPPASVRSSGGGGAVAPAAAPVAAYTPIAAPTGAAPAAAQNAYVDPSTWLTPQYDAYFGRIQQDFADRGLLDSTNKLKPMQELADAYTQRLAQERRIDYQNSVQNALSLWEKLTSGQLQQGSLALGAGLSPTLNMPAQPSIFSSIFNQQYLPPAKGTGPIGDAPVIERPVGVDASRGEVVPTYGMKYDNVAYRDEQNNAAANRAIQQAYLKLAQSADARDAAEAEKANDEDLWSEIATVAMSFFDSGIPASEVVKRLGALYDIDLVNEAYNGGNQRAIDILSLMNAQEDFRSPRPEFKPKEKAVAYGAGALPTMTPSLTPDQRGTAIASSANTAGRTNQDYGGSLKQFGLRRYFGK